MSARHEALAAAIEVNGVPSMSADGQRAAWLSSGDKVPSLVVFDVRARAEAGRLATPASGDARAFTWSYRPDIALVATGTADREDWTLYRVDVRTREWAPLGGSGERMRVAALSARCPDEVLVAAGERGDTRVGYDLISLRTGARTRLLEQVGGTAVYTDKELRPRLVETLDADGARSLWHGLPARRRLFLRIPHEDALCARFTGFSVAGDIAYFVLPDGAAATRLVALGCVDGQPATTVETQISAPRADIVSVLTDPRTGRPQLVEIEHLRRRTVALDPSLRQPLAALRHRLGTEPSILQRQPDDRHWLVAELRPDAAARYHVYEPDRDDLWPLSTSRQARDRLPIECQPVDVPLRDRHRAITYLTRPTVRTPGEDPPLAVLLVHGGPWRRSRWEYDERRAWLALQGYTVIEPNFRGSIGFGTGWVNAADLQWGAAMQDDLQDVLDWAVRNGHADPARIALVGGSYGGYAVLQLAATSQRAFRCVVASSPVTDLVAFVATPPPYWRPVAAMVRRRVGDPDDPDQRRMLADRSPIHHAGTISCPVLLVHGRNDARVPVDMTTRMFMAMAASDLEATVALFPDEGHEVLNTGNWLACRELIAAFLARHLRGEENAWDTPPETTMKLLHTPRRQAALLAARSER